MAFAAFSAGKPRGIVPGTTIPAAGETLAIFSAAKAAAAPCCPGRNRPPAASESATIAIATAPAFITRLIFIANLLDFHGCGLYRVRALLGARVKKVRAVLAARAENGCPRKWL